MREFESKSDFVLTKGLPNRAYLEKTCRIQFEFTALFKFILICRSKQYVVE